MMVTSTDEAQDMAPLAMRLVGEAFGSNRFLYADTDLKIDLPQTRIVIDREGCGHGAGSGDRGAGPCGAVSGATPTTSITASARW